VVCAKKTNRSVVSNKSRCSKQHRVRILSFLHRALRTYFLGDFLRAVWTLVLVRCTKITYFFEFFLLFFYFIYSIRSIWAGYVSGFSVWCNAIFSQTCLTNGFFSDTHLSTLMSVACCQLSWTPLQHAISRALNLRIWMMVKINEDILHYLQFIACSLLCEKSLLTCVALEVATWDLSWVRIFRKFSNFRMPHTHNFTIVGINIFATHMFLAVEKCTISTSLQRRRIPWEFWKIQVHKNLSYTTCFICSIENHRNVFRGIFCMQFRFYFWLTPNIMKRFFVSSDK
jgi:hypothetical protein